MSPAQARGFFERALALDPGNLDALLGVGGSTIRISAEPFCRTTGTRASRRPKRLAKRCFPCRPNDAWPHEIMGGVLNQTHRSAQGIAEFEQALALDPNYAAAHG